MIHSSGGATVERCLACEADRGGHGVSLSGQNL